MTQTGPGGDPFGGNAFGGDPFSGPPAGPPPPGRPAQPRPQPAETNTLATLSVVFAFVFAPAGAILGHLGLGQIASTGQRGRERALIGVTLSYAFITVAVVALVVWAAGGNDPSPSTVASAPSMSSSAPSTTESRIITTTSTPPAVPSPPKVDAAALPGVLLPLIDVRNLIGDQGQTPLGTSEGSEMPPADGGTFDDNSCLAAFVGGTPMAFDGSNQRQLYGSDSSNKQTGLQIGQAAVRFDDAAAAQKALASYIDQWRRCAGKTTQWTLPNGQVSTITYGPPVDAGGGMTTLSNSVSGLIAPAVFNRTIATKQNVLLDNSITGVGLGDIPTKVTQAMLDRIPN
jgi:hypothetical protein